MAFGETVATDGSFLIVRYGMDGVTIAYRACFTLQPILIDTKFVAGLNRLS